jgi:hypothetical protein
MLLGYAAYALFGKERAAIGALAAILVLAANPLRWGGHPTGPEELKLPMEMVRAESAGPTPPPLFFRTEQPEADLHDWRTNLAGDGYLYTPLLAYPVPNRVVPLPYHLTPEVQAYVHRTVQTELRDQAEVLLVTHEPSWIPWFAAEMKQAGFAAEVRHPNAFHVVIFRRRAPSTFAPHFTS